MSVIAPLKQGLFRIADTVGVDRLVARSSWRASRLLILCYHGVSLRDEHEWSNLYVTQDFLDRRLTALRRLGMTIMPLSAALDALWAGTLARPSVALTFDDGLADFRLRALPVLEAHDAPATVYLTTYYCTHQLPVFDPFSSYLIWKGAGKTVDLPLLGTRIVLPAQHDLIARADLHRALREAARAGGLSASDKDDVLRRMSRSVGVDYDELAAQRFMHIMTEHDVAGLPTDLVDVQLHTHRHRSPDDPSMLHEELRLNEEVIQRATGSTVPRRHFCYPSGVYSRALRDGLASYGIQSATTCDPGIASRHDDHLLLPRFVDTMAVSNRTFDAWAKGTAALLPRRRADGSMQV